MLVLFLTTFAMAEPTAETTPPNPAPILYSGTDGEASLVRTSMASGISVDLLAVHTVVDLTQSAQPKLFSLTGEERKVER